MDNRGKDVQRTEMEAGRGETRRLHLPIVTRLCRSHKEDRASISNLASWLAIIVSSSPVSLTSRRCDDDVAVLLVVAIDRAFARRQTSARLSRFSRARLKLKTPFEGRGLARLRRAAGTILKYDHLSVFAINRLGSLFHDLSL